MFIFGSVYNLGVLQRITTQTQLAMKINKLYLNKVYLSSINSLISFSNTLTPHAIFPKQASSLFAYFFHNHFVKKSILVNNLLQYWIMYISITWYCNNSVVVTLQRFRQREVSSRVKRHKTLVTERDGGAGGWWGYTQKYFTPTRWNWMVFVAGTALTKTEKALISQL